MELQDSKPHQVEEQPATHNRRFQLALIAALVFVVIVMVYASLFRPAGDGQRVEQQVQRQLDRHKFSAPEQVFREQVRNQEQRLEQQRVMQQRTRAVVQDTRAAPPQQEPVLQELLGQTRSPLESWSENESVRVRQSRQSKFGFEFYGEVHADGQPLAPSPDDSFDRFLLQEQATLAGLQRDFMAGSSFPVAAQAGPAPLASAGASAPAVARRLNLAGFPESDLEGAPDETLQLLSTGSIMSAKLDQKVVSDYAGPYRCRLERNVLDVTQRHVLIPAGSLCVGEVIQTGSGQPNSIINNRMALSVRWIVRPDGTRIKFASKALDHEGIGAIRGETNYHLSARIGGAAAFALLSGQTARADYSSTGAGATFASELGEALRGMGAAVASQYAGLAPTQTLNYGQRLRLFVSEDIYIVPWRDAYQRLLSRNRGGADA